MPMLDDRGRLFGRINLVDSAVLLAALLLLPLGVATYRVFRMPPPEIVKIDPAALRINGDRRLRVEGRNLRPYLRAFVTPAGQPVAFVDIPANPNEAEFLVERPDRAEVRLQMLGLGSYDLYLYDERREVAHRSSAFTIVPASAPPSHIVDAAMVDLNVRFDLRDEQVSMMKVGDIDVSPSPSWALKPAVLTSLRRLPGPDRWVMLQFTTEGTVGATVAPPGTRMEAVVRVGLLKSSGVWTSEGEHRVRAGETFQMATSSYIASGLITRLTVVPGLAAERADRH